MSPFSNNASDLVTFLGGINVDGGWGNEALEVLYNHCLNNEKDVSEILIIGDAACNSEKEVD